VHGSIQRIDEILCTHLNTDIKLSWLQKSASFIGFKRARQLTLKVIHMAKLTIVDELHTKRRTNCCYYKHPTIMATGLDVSIALNS
jgi:hypothetical protein